MEQARAIVGRYSHGGMEETIGHTCRGAVNLKKAQKTSKHCPRSWWDHNNMNPLLAIEAVLSTTLQLTSATSRRLDLTQIWAMFSHTAGLEMSFTALYASSMLPTARWYPKSSSA